MDSQLVQYVPVLFLLLVALAIAGGILVLSVIAGRVFNRKIAARTTQVKDIPYECGMLPIGEGSTRLSVKFYLVAMLFILFDIETIFMFVWSVVFRELLATSATLVMGGMFSFLGILFIGYIYALKKGAFDWKS
jgi:NADH-quinone oxidoreductase subunit A